ncbi:SusC/RagA family TonB-linked outer membrane protein [Mucilaginibacter gracilis]|nr:SusC/RagA family TonB-linked outer membrane protein [Mucilaginibacter gracilis]
MRLSTLIIGIQLSFFSLLMAHETRAQVSVEANQSPIKTIFSQIGQQAGVTFTYNESTVKDIAPVSLHVKNKPLTDVLLLLQQKTALQFRQLGKLIAVYRAATEKKQNPLPGNNTPSNLLLITIMGKVTDESGQPLPGATVKIKGTTVSTTTDADGVFKLINISQDATLSITFIGYDYYEVPAANNMTIALAKSISKLDEVKIIAYGTTTQRLTTGSVNTIKRQNIENQPVGNPLEVLYGRIPGLVVTETNGLPGSAIKIQIRGRTSINSSISNDPLFIIDGVPYAPNNNDIGNIGGGAAGSVSPFNSINPSDIERIDVLKDADATAIYGSRGSNGVILIQTKRGMAGATQVNANVYTGWNATTRTTDWLNTQQYVQMRKEAFKNDNVTMTSANAYDVLVWDTTRYTDFKKMLLSNTAHQTNAQLAISGGNEANQFLLSGTYFRETTMFPGDFGDKKGAVLFNINHYSNDKKLNILFSGNYVSTDNNSTANDLSNYLNLPPDLPSLYDQNGKLNWSSGGYSFANPLAYLERTYDGSTKNLISNLQVRYMFPGGLKFKTSFGYNILNINEISTTPIAAQDPSKSPTGFSTFSNSEFSSVIIEPQLDYTRSIGQLQLSALLGGTWQSNSTTGNTIAATGYTNDLLLETPAAAPSSSISSTVIKYKYVALFGRINFNYKRKFLLNLTGRRDGSSRFGPDKQFSNFGAIGLGYIFSEEQWIKSHLNFLSFGKLRSSFGLTGNDKIGDYAYLSTYTPTSQSFQGVTGLYPTSLPNSDYAWELNKKLEAALELGFLKDRVLVSTAYYNNRSSNQLINYALPSQTGGSSIMANFPATVVNSGVEIEITTINLSKHDLKWSTSFNITVPKNRLQEFPRLSSSSYSNLIIGQPLSVLSGLQFADINPATGILEFRNASGGITTSPVYASDKNINIGNTEPKCYGGLENNLQFRNWNLDFLFEFRKQIGTTIIGNLYNNTTYPGTMYNQPIIVLNRWQAPGDVSNISKYTTTSTSAAYASLNNVRIYGTDYRYGDASYARLKNIVLTYSMPPKWIRRAGLKSLQLYSSAQNLLVITDYKYADPETQTLQKTPPVRTITVGLKTNF